MVWVGCVNVTILLAQIQTKVEDNKIPREAQTCAQKFAHAHARAKDALEQFQRRVAAQRTLITVHFAQIETAVNRSKRAALSQLEAHANPSLKLLETHTDQFEVFARQAACNWFAGGLAVNDLCDDVKHPCDNVPVPVFHCDGVEIVREWLNTDACWSISYDSGRYCAGDNDGMALEWARVKLLADMQQLVSNARQDLSENVFKTQMHHAETKQTQFSGKRLATIQTGSGCTDNVYALAVSPLGDVGAIIHRGTDSIAIVSFPRLEILRIFGKEKKDSGWFDYLKRLCFSANGEHILVSDKHWIEEIQVETGKHVRNIGDRMLASLTCMDVNATHVVASETKESGSCIYLFAYSSGAFLKKFGQVLRNCVDVKFSPNGTQIIATESTPQRVLIFTVQGSFVRHCEISKNDCLLSTNILSSGEILVTGRCFTGPPHFRHNEWNLAVLRSNGEENKCITKLLPSRLCFSQIVTVKNFACVFINSEVHVFS